MNDNLNDFLNRMGLNDVLAADAEATEVLEEATTTAVVAPTVSEPEQMSQDDFAHLLNEVGLTTPPEADAEEVHNVEDVDFEDDDEEEDDEQTWEETSNDPTANDREESTQEPSYTSGGILDQLAHTRYFNYVGDQDLVNEGDIRNNPETGELEVLTDSGVVPLIHEEPRDLDAEENADWQELIDSGGVVPLNDAARRIANTVASTADAHIGVDVAAPDENDAIPQNSPTLLRDESTSRFSGAEWYNEVQSKSIILAGCGGIGSFLGFQLARMKPTSMVLYDDDIVEEANMSGQLYSRNDEGHRKVQALRDLINRYTSACNIYASATRYDDTCETGDVMICGFDNMEARKTFFRSWINHVFSKPIEERKKCLYLDGRLSVDTLQVFCLTGDAETNINRYREEYLFDDSEAEETVCSLKQTSYMACMIGSFMTNLFVNWCANLVGPIIPYDLPFFTEYDAQNMLFKVTR